MGCLLSIGLALGGLHAGNFVARAAVAVPSLRRSSALWRRQLEPERERSIVHQTHLHVSAKDALLGLEAAGAQGGGEVVDQAAGEVRRRGGAEAGAPASGGVS